MAEPESHETSVRVKFASLPDDFIHVVYRPLTPDILSKQGMVEQLAASLIEISLTDEGCALEPTQETLERIPLPVLTNIAETIFADYYPQKRDVANLEIFYTWKSHSRARAPGDLEIFELALELNRTPDEIRSMSRRDRDWMLGVKIARQRAMREAQRRANMEGN
jgi:hypothetical protein